MDWAVRRQLLYALGVFLFLACVGGLIWYFFIYEPPTCTDGLQNQGEFGPDCEGPCAKLCSIPRVDPLWARPLLVAEGVYHGVASVKNPLSNARATGLMYSLALYDDDNILIAERRGTIDLYPGETRVVFEPNIIAGSRVPVRAFMKVDGGYWEKSDSVESPILIVSQQLDTENLRLTGVLENVTAEPVNSIIANALLYDADDIVVAASETRFAVIPGRGRQDVSFTWPTAFPRPVVRADISIRVPHDAPTP
ncbi:MAG: hypothetical protein AAB955_02585 [Patescibacteria group bacterium]